MNTTQLTQEQPVSQTQAFDVHSFIFVKNNITVEQASTQKANSFYGGVTDITLKGELIADFTEMELAYLRNDYLEFGRRVHKQIEAIVNYSLFNVIGLNQLQSDLLNIYATNSKKESKKIGEIVLLPKRFNDLQNKPINRNDMSQTDKENLFCYYFVNLNQDGSKQNKVINFDYKINNGLNVVRIKASHGQTTFDNNKQNDFNNALSNTAKFYFECFHLLSKFRYAAQIGI